MQNGTTTVSIFSFCFLTFSVFVFLVALSHCRSHAVQEAQCVPDDRRAAPGARIPESKPRGCRQSHHIQPPGEKGPRRPWVTTWPHSSMVQKVFGFQLTLCDVFPALSKICCRCGAEYKINVNGNCIRKEECSFHWGRLRRHKGEIYLVQIINKHQYYECTLFSTYLCLCPTRSFPSSPSVAGGWETNYSCCAAAVGAPGCQVSKVSSFSNSC